METVCMKCQILFSGEKNKKNIINLTSAELSQKVVKVKCDKCFEIKTKVRQFQSIKSRSQNNTIGDQQILVLQRELKAYKK